MQADTHSNCGQEGLVARGFLGTGKRHGVRGFGIALVSGRRAAECARNGASLLAQLGLKVLDGAQQAAHARCMNAC